MSDSRRLAYTVHGCSGFSAPYVPQNVLTDRPNDQLSRWSSESNYPPQFLTLKLEKPAIVEKITFGKYEKTHVCNLKKFKVCGGMTDSTMIELLDSGLKNDSLSETFMLKHAVQGQVFPCRFIKIVPIQSWGPSFNFSIWHIDIKGNDNITLVQKAHEHLTNCQEKEAIRLCLKHFRQHNYSEAFESLQKKTKVYLENELLTQLHDMLVIKGDFGESERLLECAANEGLFNNFLRRQEYQPKWTPITPRTVRPGMRGGHQMCIDPLSETVYLFGGWDGTRDLPDMWSYHIPTGEWNCLSKDTSVEGGPSARSCHKMCLDPQRKKIFTLGRYLDQAYRVNSNLKSDFYVYDIEANKWQLITDDTAAMGGPSLVFDHQMCFDVEKNTIYVFGGRVLVSTASPNEERGSIPPSTTNTVNGPEQPQFSGLFAYHVPTNSWTRLCDDMIQLCSNSKEIKSRTGHSMLFHEKSRLLYILAGQRQKEYLSDFMTYHVDSGEVKIICDGFDEAVPAAGFTQRATIDPDLNEINVLSGISKDKDKREENVRNSFWVYDILDNRWSCIYRNENKPENESASGSATSFGDDIPEGPRPRFAHQLVYDHLKKVHYLFGGNPGSNKATGSHKQRLDDFWSLELMRCSKEQLLRQCRRLIRELAFKEKINENPIEAVQYLQSKLSEVFDHNNPEEREMFQLLASCIFGDPTAPDEELTGLEAEENASQHTARTKVYDLLIEFFPEEMTQPKGNLVDLIVL